MGMYFTGAEIQHKDENILEKLLSNSSQDQYVTKSQVKVGVQWEASHL